jgi:paraquat-inducible protein B
MSKPIGKPIIGAFVLGAVAILVAGLFVLGGGKFLKKKYMRVMYFDGSVKGLKVGAPVAFRGVEIGTVSNVAIRTNTKDLTTLIPVVVEIDPDSIETTGGQLGDRLPRLIKRGLRAKLELQSLVTGQLQIELDFMPDTEARLVGAKSKYAEIPTVPSTLRKLADELEKFPLKEIGDRLSKILTIIEKIVENPELGQSIHNLNQTLLDTQKLIKDVDRQIDPLATRIKNTADAARPAIEEAEKALANIATLTDKGSEERKQLNRTLKEFQAAVRAIKALAEYLERNPEALIHGKGKSKRR